MAPVDSRLPLQIFGCLADLEYTRAGVACFQNNFPERLGTAIVCPANMLFRVLYRIVSPFLDPVTRRKVVPLADASGLGEYIAPDQLEVRLGGTLVQESSTV